MLIVRFFIYLQFFLLQAVSELNVWSSTFSPGKVPIACPQIPQSSTEMPGQLGKEGGVEENQEDKSIKAKDLLSTPETLPEGK